MRLRAFLKKSFPWKFNGKRFYRKYTQAPLNFPALSSQDRLSNSLLRKVKQCGLCSIVHLRSGGMHIDWWDVSSYLCVFKNSALPVSQNIASVLAPPLNVTRIRASSIPHFRLSRDIIQCRKTESPRSFEIFQERLPSGLPR